VTRAKAASRPRDADIAHDSTHLMQDAAPGGFTPEIASSPKPVATRPRRRTARWVARCVAITGLIGLAVALGYLASGLLSYDPGGGATLAADAVSPDAPQTASSATEDAWARRDLAEARAPDASGVSAERGLDRNASPQVDSGGARRPPDRGRKRPPGKQRKRRPQIVAGELGRLSVDSDPWSSVYLDGKRLGTTPLWLVSVPAGRHRLRLVTSHGRSTERWLLVPEGGSLNLGTIDLRARQP